MVVKLSKKVHFWLFCADLSKKPKSVKAFTYMHLKALIAVSKNDMVYRGLSSKISEKMLTQQKFNKIFQLQNPIFPKQ